MITTPFDRFLKRLKPPTPPQPGDPDFVGPIYIPPKERPSPPQPGEPDFVGPVYIPKKERPKPTPAPIKEEPTPESVKEELSPYMKRYTPSIMGDWPKTTGIEPIPKKFLGLPEYRQHIFGEYEKAVKYISEAEAYKISILPGGEIWESIEPGMQYEYTFPATHPYMAGETAVLTSAAVKQEFYEESKRIDVKQLTIQHSKLWKHYQETGEYPAGTKIVKTATGYQVIVPDTRLEWAKGERQKIEGLPPGIKEVAMFGYTAVSSFAALGKSIAPFILEQPERLGLLFGPYGWAMGKVMRETGFVPSGIKPSEMKPVHYVSGLDIVFEHFGLAPKGAVEELRKTGPAGWAGAAAGEFLQLAGFHYALKPVGVGVKYVGGKVIAYPPFIKGVTKISTGLGKGFTYTAQKVSPYLPRTAVPALKTARFGVKEFIRVSPKRFGLKITKKVPYIMKEAPIATTRFGIAAEKMGAKLGLLRFTEYGTKVSYRRLFWGLPRLTETGKLVFGRPQVYGTIGKDIFGISKRAAVYGIEPTTGKLTIISGKYTLGRPYGLLGRKISATRGITGLSYEQMLMPDITDISRTTKEWGVAAGKRWWVDPDAILKSYYPYFPPVSKGKIVSKVVEKYPSLTGTFTTGGAMPRLTLTRGEQQLLRFAEATGQPYESISKLMLTALKTRFPKMLFVSPQATEYSSNLLAGLLGGGIIAIPHLTQVGISKLEREMRQPTIFKSTKKRITVKILTFERAITGASGTAITNALKQSLIDASALMDFSITGITPAQAQVQKQAQLQAFMFEQVSLQKAKQVAVTRALPQLTIPAIFFPPRRLYGRARRYPERDIWGLEYRYRKAVIPSMSEVDRRIRKAMGIGLRPTKSRKKLKKRRR